MYAWFKQCDLKRKVIIPLLVLIEKQIRLFFNQLFYDEIETKTREKNRRGEHIPNFL